MAKRRYLLKFRTKLIIVLLFLGYFASLLIQQEWEMRQQVQKIAALEHQILEVQENSEMLYRQLIHTRSDEYIEQIARERLGWVKEGEIIFIEKNN